VGPWDVSCTEAVAVDLWGGMHAQCGMAVLTVMGRLESRPRGHVASAQHVADKGCTLT